MSNYKAVVESRLGDKFHLIEKWAQDLEDALIDHRDIEMPLPGIDTTVEMFRMKKDNKEAVEHVSVRYTFSNFRRFFKKTEALLHAGHLLHSTLLFAPLVALIIYKEAKKSSITITGGHAATLYAIYELQGHADSPSILTKMKTYDLKQLEIIPNLTNVEKWLDDLIKMKCVELKDGRALLLDDVEIES